MGDAALPLRLLQQEVGVLRQRVAELEAARMAEARRTQALLGRLAAGLSHELRNPLGAVVLHMDLLEEILRQPATNSEDEVVQALSEIRTNPTVRKEVPTRITVLQSGARRHIPHAPESDRSRS